MRWDSRHYPRQSGFPKWRAEVLIESARFWVSLYSADPEHAGVNLLFYIGPDEYCVVTSNSVELIFVYPLGIYHSLCRT